MPDVVGLSEGQAQEFLARVGLIPVFGGSRNDDSVGSGRVLDQALPPGQPVAVGEPVTYTLSLGPQFVTVLDLTNVPASFAQQQTEELGLLVEMVNEPSQTVGEGLVISQDPAPGTQVAPGTLMRLVVSMGDKVLFPDIIGMNRFQAEDLIRRTGELNLVYVDEQGRDHLGASFDQYQPYEVVSAEANGQPVQNGQFIPRGSGIVLGVRAPE